MSGKPAPKPRIQMITAQEPGVAPKLDPNETPLHSQLALAQDMWGEGTLSPLDNLYTHAGGSTLTVNSSQTFATVGCGFGSSLPELSQKCGVWIDEFEVEKLVEFIHTSPKSKVRKHAWKPGAGLLGDHKLNALLVCHGSRLAPSPQSLIGECATSLREGGMVFLGDLVTMKDKTLHFLAPMTAHTGSVPPLSSGKAYQQALDAAGLQTRSANDVTQDAMSHIREGFQRSEKFLPALRALPDPWKSQRLLAFCAEFEGWSLIYRMLEAGDLAVMRYLAVKPRRIK